MSEIVCPNCESRQPANAVFCDNCGFGLIGGAAPTRRQAQPGAPAEPPPTPAFVAMERRASAPDLKACSACGAFNLPEARFCDQCGSALAVQTAPRRQPATPTPASESERPVVDQTLPESPPADRFVTGRLNLEPTGTRLEFPPGSAEVFVGREDPVSNIFPEIDLTPYGGEAAGVSRRHARFSLQGGQLVVEDLDSTNFTFVNRKRVMPGARQEVRNGDELRFGRIAARYEEI